MTFYINFVITLHVFPMVAAPEELWLPCGSLLGTPDCCPGLCQGHLPECDLLTELCVEFKQHDNETAAAAVTLAS